MAFDESTRRNAIIVIVLSVCTAFTGNLFLAVTGIITGIITMTSTARNQGMDLVAMLAFATGILAMLYTFAILPVGVFILTANPARVCSISEGFTHAAGVGALGAPSPPHAPPLPYPWNLTETAQGHRYYGSVYYSPKIVHSMQYLSKVVCGDNAPAMLMMAATAVLSYAFFIVLPLMIYSLRILRAARREGACSDCAGPRQIVVQYAPAPVRGAPVRGAPVGAGGDPNIPVARAIPVHPGNMPGNLAHAVPAQPARGVSMGASTSTAAGKEMH